MGYAKVIPLIYPSDTIIEKVGSDWVVFHGAQRRAFSLSATTYSVWQLVARNPLEDLRAATCREFGVDPDQAANIVGQALELLADSGFVSYDASIIPRRDFISRSLRAALIPTLFAMTLRPAHSVIVSTQAQCICSATSPTCVASGHALCFHPTTRDCCCANQANNCNGGCGNTYNLLVAACP